MIDFVVEECRLQDELLKSYGVRSIRELEELIRRKPLTKASIEWLVNFCKSRYNTLNEICECIRRNLRKGSHIRYKENYKKAWTS